MRNHRFPSHVGILRNTVNDTIHADWPYSVSVTTLESTDNSAMHSIEFFVHALPASGASFCVSEAPQSPPQPQLMTYDRNHDGVYDHLINAYDSGF